MPASDVLVRTARHDDMAEIAACFAHYVNDTVVSFEEVAPTTADWRRRFDEIVGRGLPFLVAEAAGGQVIGFAFAAPWRSKPAYRYSVEDSVYLAPGWTGKGLGRALLGALLAGCLTAGVHQVIAVIAAEGSEEIADAEGSEDAEDSKDSAGGGGDGTASVALHRAFGFTYAGRLRGVGHKHGRRLDTILMQRDMRREPPAGAADLTLSNEELAAP